ncbi:MAG: hypothetical protein H0V44_03365, partial [Planctomycetes bacterium]|nr:hypothetical protein [Planctomycetota bacterium]
MKLDKSKVEIAFSEIKNAMEGIGFKRRSQEIYTHPITKNVVGWVGLNRKVAADESLEINPVIGVRHQEVEKMVAQLSGVEFHQYIPPSISIPLGYLEKGKYAP